MTGTLPEYLGITRARSLAHTYTHTHTHTYIYIHGDDEKKEQMRRVIMKRNGWKVEGKRCGMYAWILSDDEASEIEANMKLEGIDAITFILHITVEHCRSRLLPDPNLGCVKVDHHIIGRRRV